MIEEDIPFFGIETGVVDRRIDESYPHRVPFAACMERAYSRPLSSQSQDPSAGGNRTEESVNDAPCGRRNFSSGQIIRASNRLSLIRLRIRPSSLPNITELNKGFGRRK